MKEIANILKYFYLTPNKFHCPRRPKGFSYRAVVDVCGIGNFFIFNFWHEVLLKVLAVNLCLVVEVRVDEVTGVVVIIFSLWLDLGVDSSATIARWRFILDTTMKTYWLFLNLFTVRKNKNLF